LKIALKMKIQDLESYKELTAAKDKEIEILQDDLALLRSNESSVIQELNSLISERVDEQQSEAAGKSQAISSLSLVKVLKDLLATGALNDSTSLATVRTTDTLSWLDGHDSLDSRLKEEITSKVKTKFLEMKKKHQTELEEREEQHRTLVAQVESTCEQRIMELSSQLNDLQLELNTRLEEVAEAHRKHELERGSHDTKVGELEHDLLAKTDEIATLGRQMAKTRAECDRFQLDNEALVAEVLKLTEENRHSSESVALQTNELNSMLSSFQDRETELMAEITALRGESENAQSLLLEREEQISSLLVSLDNLRTEQSLRENLEKELSDLIEKNQADHDAKLQHCHIQMEEMQVGFDKELGRLSAERLEGASRDGDEMETLRAIIRDLTERLEENERNRPQVVRIPSLLLSSAA
jgi:hypothetical protein